MTTRGGDTVTMSRRRPRTECPEFDSGRCRSSGRPCELPRDATEAESPWLPHVEPVQPHIHCGRCGSLAERVPDFDGWRCTNGNCLAERIYGSEAWRIP